MVLVVIGLCMAASQRVQAMQSLDFSLELSVQLSGLRAVVPESSWNPANDLAGLPESGAVLDVRPDIYLNAERWSLMLRPRFSSSWEKVQDSQGTSTGQSHDAVINEWRLRLYLPAEIDLSVGREHLLWGPARLLMASNPFGSDTGRDNPFTEVSGQDLIRLSRTLGVWSLSAYALVGEGADRHQRLPPLQAVDPQPGFRPVYALKVDRMGFSWYGSLNFARYEGRGWGLGGFWDWTATEATRLYADGRVTEQRRGWRPERDQSWPVGWAMRAAGSGAGGMVVAGLAHTTTVGPTLTIEGM